MLGGLENVRTFGNAEMLAGIWKVSRRTGLFSKYTFARFSRRPCLYAAVPNEILGGARNAPHSRRLRENKSFVWGTQNWALPRRFPRTKVCAHKMALANVANPMAHRIEPQIGKRRNTCRPSAENLLGSARTRRDYRRVTGRATHELYL